MKRTKILQATSVGGHPLATRLDSLVGLALKIRGADPHLLLCDGVLPACELVMYTELGGKAPDEHYTPSKSRCASCLSGGLSEYQHLPIPLIRYSQFIDPDSRISAERFAASATLEECFQYTDRDGVRLGEQVRAGVIRFFGNSALSLEDPTFLLRIARDYLRAALITAVAINRVFDVMRPDCVVNHHGIYVPQGIIDDIAKKRGIPLVVWGSSQRNGTFIFAHGDTYHRALIDEPNSLWEDLPFEPWQQDLIERYIQARANGKGDWKWITDQRGGASLEVPKLTDLGLDPDKPTFCLLPNIGWDAQLYYANLAFPSMIDWLSNTLRYFAERPDRQLIVRIHPWEAKGGNREFVSDHLQRNFPRLPPNIAVVDKNSSYSTYAIAEASKAVLLYGTKAGIELSAMGIPVVAAADAWVKRKGFTIDANSADEYFSILEDLASVQRLSGGQLERAKKYAFHYFFRRMIPLRSLSSGEEFPPRFNFSLAEDLLPSRDPGLDVICEGILTGSEFVYEPRQGEKF